MEDIKQNIVDNLVLLRKSKKITQQELAKQINYTDKAVSRWEKGESLPEISVLCQICEYYGVDFEWLIHKHSDVPKMTSNKSNKIRIAILLVIVFSIYLFATSVYVYNLIKHDLNYWRIFVWSLPAVFLACMVCCKMWWKIEYFFISLSAFVWSLTFSIILHLYYTREELMWPLFLICIPVQVVILLVWFIHKESLK